MEKTNKWINRKVSKYIHFVMVILINLFCYWEKIFILMNIWTAGKNLMKPHYHIKKLLINLNLNLSNLNLEHISDGDYAHAQKVWYVFEIKNLVEYHDFYFQSDTLLLADVYESFRDMCLDLINRNLILHILYLHLD